MIYIGIDNGVSGTIGVVGDNTYFGKVPVKKELSYTKKKAFITRIDSDELEKLLRTKIGGSLINEVRVVLERPMINPGRFQASISASRALESTLNVIQRIGLSYRYIDSKEWQKEMLPKGLKGVELKKASLDIGNRIFPKYSEVKHEDRDGLLMAEYLRKSNG